MRPGRLSFAASTVSGTFAISDEFPLSRNSNLWTDTAIGVRDREDLRCPNQLEVIERCMLMTTDPGDLVLDPTCGSGTTAFVAEQWGRRWITIDTSRVALALARQRLMGARYPVPPCGFGRGSQKESELTDSHCRKPKSPTISPWLRV